MKTTDEPVSHQETTLPATDGYELGIARFMAKDAPKARIILAGATAVPQRFYSRFATYAAQRGFETTTLDYRGIGRSKSKTVPLREFSASFLDWAQRDLAAVIDAVPGDGLPLFVVGHSFGGHAIGLIPNLDRLSAGCAFGVGAGWHGWMDLKESVRVRLHWNVVMPALVAWKGYLPWSLGGAGEDIPVGVYQQWRRWCGFPRYFLDDPTYPELAKLCARVTIPVMGISALDDAWAPPLSREAFLINAYPNAILSRINVDPRELGPIGHMGYFRKNAAPLWDRALTWLEARIASSKAPHEEDWLRSHEMSSPALRQTD